MKLAKLAAIGAVASCFACGTRYIDTAQPGLASGGSSAGYGGAPACAGSFAQRLSVITVTLGEDIRAKASAYDWLQRDERLAFAIGPDQKPSVAWLNSAGDTVHVSAFDTDGTSLRKDVTLPSSEVGGLLVKPDGFALLTSGPDLGEALPDPNQGNIVPNRAALLSRYRNGDWAFHAALTGTEQVTMLTGDDRRDCTPMPFAGRLASDGSRYGAYFAVHGCAGHTHASFYSDKLTYLNDAGQAVRGGFYWACSNTSSLALLAEASAFTSLCFSDGEPKPGLDLIFENSYTQLALEAHRSGYVGGQFGSVVKTSDGGYALVWASRGALDSDTNPAAKDNPDIAFMLLGPDYSVRIARTWLSDTSDVAEYNVHAAPYGRGRLLVLWDSVAVSARRGETGFGAYQGTFAQLFDLSGNALGASELLNAPPNSWDDISVYANGDLGWAWVDAPRDYQQPLTPEDIPSQASTRNLKMARLEYCE